MHKNQPAYLFLLVFNFSQDELCAPNIFIIHDNPIGGINIQVFCDKRMSHILHRPA